MPSKCVQIRKPCHQVNVTKAIKRLLFGKMLWSEIERRMKTSHENKASFKCDLNLRHGQFTLAFDQNSLSSWPRDLLGRIAWRTSAIVQGPRQWWLDGGDPICWAESNVVKCRTPNGETDHSPFRHGNLIRNAHGEKHFLTLLATMQTKQSGPPWLPHDSWYIDHHCPLVGISHHCLAMIHSPQACGANADWRAMWRVSVDTTSLGKVNDSTKQTVEGRETSGSFPKDGHPALQMFLGKNQAWKSTSPRKWGTVQVPLFLCHASTRYSRCYDLPHWEQSWIMKENSRFILAVHPKLLEPIKPYIVQSLK